jgi:hypothetical protein
MELGTDSSMQSCCGVHFYPPFCAVAILLLALLAGCWLQSSPGVLAALDSLRCRLLNLLATSG